MNPDKLAPNQKFSLQPLRELLEQFGSPHLHLPPIVHVAGTNGKGSTLAFLKAILEAAGKCAHRYTSPSLLRLNERIEIAGVPITDEQFAHYESLLPVDIKLTPFERFTGMAFMVFRDHPADYALVEVGMGGQLDATNVIEKPVCTAITSIGFDHQEFLGTALTEIAWQKVGILKPGVPVVTGRQVPEVGAVIKEEARRLGCPFYQAESQGFMDLALKGAHQQENAGIAVKIAEILEIEQAAVQQGLRTAMWPGRLQQLRPNLWIDGAHNAAGAAALAQAVCDWQPLILIWGMLRRKDPTTFLKAFQGLDPLIYTVPIANNDCFTAQELADIGASQGLEAVPCQTLPQALSAAYNREARILICGSLYLVGEALRLEIL